MYQNQRLEEIRTHVLEVDNAEGGLAFLKKICGVYGFRNSAYIALALPKLTQDGPVFIATYPDAWVDHYVDSNYVEIDPVLRLAIRRLLPSDWSELKDHSKLSTRMFREAELFGIGNKGFTVPIRGALGELALFSVSAQENDNSWDLVKNEFMMELQMIAFYFHDMILRSNGIAPKVAELAPREIEVLKWMANGKTAADVAAILNLSNSTVRHYLETARNKLGALNKTHAVARAMSHSMISMTD